MPEDSASEAKAKNEDVPEAKARGQREEGARAKGSGIALKAKLRNL